jgi:hypothetical protein
VVASAVAWGCAARLRRGGGEEEGNVDSLGTVLSHQRRYHEIYLPLCALVKVFIFKIVLYIVPLFFLYDFLALYVITTELA